MIWASKAEHSTFWTHSIGSFDPPPKRPRTGGEGIEVLYSNVTQWNRDAKEWLLQQDLQLAMLVETHVAGPKLLTAAHEMARSRWQVTAMEAYETGRDGTSGGQFFCCREGQSSYKIHHFDKAGNGFLANVVQRQNWEVVLVSIYLKCGEDLNSTTNAAVLGELAAFLGELAVPWLVVGDFQVPPAQWHGHQLLNVLKAEVVSGGEPTLLNGAEIDYVVASRALTPFIDIKVNWDAPWKPHAGLVITIDSSAPRLHLPQVTQYAAMPKLQHAAKPWGEFRAAPKPYWLGRTMGPKELQCAGWCHKAKQYALQNLAEPRCGRGWYLAIELKPLPMVRFARYEKARPEREDLAGNYLVDLDHDVGYGPASGPVLPALDTHPTIYSFQGGRLLLPQELLAAQGVDMFPAMAVTRPVSPLRDVFSSFSANDLRFFAGNSMHVPTLGAWLMYAMGNVLPRSSLERLPRALGDCNSEESDELEALGG